MNHTAPDPAVRVIEAAINYVAPGSFINRRFVAPGVEHNTGRYEAHRVSVRDGRLLTSSPPLLEEIPAVSEIRGISEGTPTP